MRSDLAALAAVILWGSLAAIAVALNNIPPLLMTGLGLIIGSIISLPVAGFKIRRILPSSKMLLVAKKVVAVMIHWCLLFHYAVAALALIGILAHLACS